MLLSLVNKEIALGFDRTAAQIGRVDRTECWEKEAESGRHHEAPPEMDVG